MKSLKGTKTEQNILKTFAGESQARNRYDYFASVAQKEGLVQVAHIFTETALQEKEHAKRMFKLLSSGEAVEITASFPAGKIGTTIENLTEAAGGEYEEWSDLYPSFAKTAREEGFEEIAVIWDNISIAEKHHEERFKLLLKNIKDGVVFKKAGEVVWACLNCGYTETATEAPKACPACAHPQAYFALKYESF